jgi:hypothetical protein
LIDVWFQDETRIRTKRNSYPHMGKEKDTSSSHTPTAI